jgi:hypothetical protein
LRHQNSNEGIGVDQLKEIIGAINSFSPSPLAVICLALLLAIILALKM